MEGFEAEMQTSGKRKGGRRASTFLQTPRADFEGVDLIGDIVKASVRFLAEFRSRSERPGGRRGGR
jgi:predicted lipid-binding transport protein (Tim44 family)